MEAHQFFTSEEGKKYLKIFQDSVIVIKYGGAALESSHMMSYFLQDVAQMFLNGLKIVLVHGGGKKLSAAMKAANLPVEFENGMRKTSPAAAELAAKSFRELNESICQYLNSFGVATQAITNGDGIWASLIDKDIPDNRVGKIERIETSLLQANKLPVISSIARSVGPPVDKIKAGEYLNLNADYVAMEFASQLKAAKIIFISDVNGIYLDPNDPQTKISHINEKEIQKLIKENVLTGGMKLKVEMSLQALRSGVEKVHYIDGSIQYSTIKEIFTDEGIGTEIVL